MEGWRLGQRARWVHRVGDHVDRGVDRADLRILLVHHAPDHARGEQRDRHRHEDDRLERNGPAHALQQHGEHEPDRRHERGHDRQPQDVVLDRRGQGVLGEQLLVVVEPDEVRALAVEEAAHDRVDRRVDDPHAEQDRGRGEERDRDAVPCATTPAPPQGAEPRPAAAAAAPPLIGLGVHVRTLSPPTAPSPARRRPRRRGCAGSPGTPSRDPAPPSRRTPPAGGRRGRSGTSPHRRSRSRSPAAAGPRTRCRRTFLFALEKPPRFAQISAASGVARYSIRRLRGRRVVEHDDRVTTADHRRAASRRSPGSRTR